MKSQRHFHRATMYAVVLILASLTLIGCGSTPQELRITNGGAQPITNLTVLFPDGEVQFGDIPVGATTQYRPVPNGVYSYAAYRLTVAGEEITQPVIDWVGEVPMEGKRFTYVLDFDPSRSQIQMVQLGRVVKDE